MVISGLGSCAHAAEVVSNETLINGLLLETGLVPCLEINYLPNCIIIFLAKRFKNVSSYI